MKTSKPAKKTSAQEECGVWLDTAELKRRAKQKRPARPISKLLNPFIGGGGYSLAVALNFTQTKIEMPKTKQSSLSAYFAPQRRVLNKMSTSEVPNMDPVLTSSSSTSTTCALATPEASGRKRQRETDIDFHCSGPGVDHEWKIENVPQADVWLDRRASHTLSQNMHCEDKGEQFEEIIRPQSKKKPTAASSLPVDSQPPPQAWSQDPLFSCSQYSESEFDQNDQENTTAKDHSDSEPSFFNILQSEDAFGVRMGAEATTSTQKAFQHVQSSRVDDQKKSRFSSPSKRSSLSQTERLSNQKWTEPKTASPRKHNPAQSWIKSDKDDNHNSQFKWIKPSSPRLKKTRLTRKVVDEDSLAALFTQDSEGFRVIAHRGLQARSPLKDQSNQRSIFRKSLVEEDDEEDEMLFTQDSQGNLVIKH